MSDTQPGVRPASQPCVTGESGVSRVPLPIYGRFEGKVFLALAPVTVAPRLLVPALLGPSPMWGAHGAARPAVGTLTRVRLAVYKGSLV